MGGYTDCYTTDLPLSISQQDYIEAFYTTWLFKLERLILKWLVAKPSTDLEAKQLAEGKIKNFAAWIVEERLSNQILLCDFQGKTRSFLMSESIAAILDKRQTPSPKIEHEVTRLYFGSAIVASKGAKEGDPTLSFYFKALVGFHRLYSRALLFTAKKRLISLQYKN